MNVKKMQCLLTVLDYPCGGVDGVWGPQTEAALKQFCLDAGIADEGIGEAAAAALRRAVAEQKPDFWQSVKWFTREEFRCKCGGRFCGGEPAQMREEAVRIADAAREHFGRPGHIVSGLRCPEWNAHEGGVANSQHQYGEAVDLYIEGVDAQTLRRFVSSQPGHRYSYCITDSNVHFDIPAGRRAP